MLGVTLVPSGVISSNISVKIHVLYLIAPSWWLVCFMSQTDFFSDNNRQILPIDDGELLLIPQAFSPETVANLFVLLREQVQWSQDEICIAGRQVAIPRLQAWYGDSDAFYSYSGLSMKPSVWTQTLLGIKQTVEALTEATFNSVLLNLYRDGRDSMGWHSDDEPELGVKPVIASVSFGATRDFVLRHKQKDIKKIKLSLPNGSLLLMSGRLQQYWQHQVPKTRLPVGERINLTFRLIKPDKGVVSQGLK